MLRESKKVLVCMGLSLMLADCRTSTGDLGAESGLRDNRERDGQGDYQPHGERGWPSEYDPGPKKDSLWVPLFGSVPNYRKIGKDYTGSEKFRWNIGPMWYRGRLGENQVKVVVVGQEGAQDENTSNRTFTGGTGTKTQNMLAALEMDRSYLFLNTFVYTIFGQRDTEDSRYMDMEQGADSPIVQYRHQLFDYTAQYNADTLSMFVAVGGGGKDSLVNWIESRGGQCPNGNANACDTSRMKIYKQEFGDQRGANEAGLVSSVPGVRYTNETVRLQNQSLVIHVAHPGQARFEGGLENVQRSFSYAASRIQSFVRDNPTWLDGQNNRPKPDTGTREDIIRNFEDFQYRNTPVAHRDFAYATTWRLGDGGTNTTRDGQDAIVIWADGEEYGSRGRHNTSILGRENRDGRQQNDGRPWEPQRWDPRNPDFAKSYDYGPCGYVMPGEYCELSKLMMTWPNFNALGVKAPVQDASFGFGPTYRGNPQAASLIVLADQYSHDDFFTARAMTGEVGQKLQTWLKNNNYSNTDDNTQNDYVILRTLPVDTMGMSSEDILALATHPDVVAVRNNIFGEILRQSREAGISSVKAVSIGTEAGQVSETVNAELAWQRLSSRDLPEQLTDIPRADLPYSTRFFMGTSGNRATADKGKWYRFEAPYWVARTPIPN